MGGNPQRGGVWEATHKEVGYRRQPTKRWGMGGNSQTGLAANALQFSTVVSGVGGIPPQNVQHP